METKIAVFKGKGIRKVIHNNEWWFSVVDVCIALTSSADSGAYWRKLKQRLKEEGSEVVTFCHGLKMPAPDGKMRETDCANMEGIFASSGRMRRGLEYNMKASCLNGQEAFFIAEVYCECWRTFSFALLH